jgi:hypothetical protein
VIEESMSVSWWGPKTPMQTFLDTIPLAQEKIMAA